MLTFGSDEWIAALDDAARADAQLATASAELALVVEQVLTDGTRGHVVVDHGTVRVRPGPADRPTVTFTQDRAVAAAIARGDDSAQAAFLRGDLRLGGDVGALVAQAALLDRLTDAFAGVRSATAW